MAAELEKELDELHLCLADTTQSGSARAFDIVGNIDHICLQDVTDKDIDYCCALLFSTDRGVVTFLKNVVQQDEYQGCKASLLEMLLSFIIKYDKKLLSYVIDLKDVCMSLFLRDRFAKVKNNAIPVIIEVIKLSSGSSMAEELHIVKMVEKFFTELTFASKYAPTVKQHIYHLLGVVAEVYPELMINYGDRLVDLYVRTIKTQMTSKTRKPELSLIAGSLQGLTHLLVQFTQSADEGAKHSYDIYKFTCKAIAKDVQVTRYEMPRSGLELLAKHASQFNQYLLDDYEEMYDRLSFWSNHHNREMLHLGMSAMEGFFKQISYQLVSLAKEGRKEGSVFTYFVKKFRRIMDSPDSTSKEISLAIRGYGYFAAPCKLFMSDEDVKFMFTEMVQRSEQMFFGQIDNLDDKVIGLPNFLEALASIITELDQVSDTFLLSLEKLIVILMENFPKLPKKMHFRCFLSVLKVFFSLAPKGAVFKGFLTRVVYQGLIRTCSHPVVMDTENVDQEEEEVILENRQQTISYKDYVHMWTILLNSAKVKDLAGLDIGLDQRRAFTEALYDEMLSSILQIIDRLDLTCAQPGQDENEANTSSHDNEEEEMTSDPIQGLQAAKPKDFVIFINLVAFSRELLPTTHTHLFKKWIFTFGHDLILHSTKFPLVSGFYKLLGVCVTIAGTTRYFKGIGDVFEPLTMTIKLEIKQESQDMEIDETPDTDLSNREACFMLFNKFTKEVLVRLKQYKDDLLASCLLFILSLPREIVVTELPSIVPAVQMALQIGRSYIPLANAGLDALETWSRTLPDHVIRPHYRNLLQHLDPYLKSGADTGGSAGGSNQTVSLTSQKPSRRSGKKKIPVRLLKQKEKAASKESAESQLAQVRQRCVLMLGSLGGAVNNVLVSSSAEELSKSAVAWDNVKHLKFDMPFMDIKPVIYFDPFLPRVVELATTSSERQTKVAACELLHSLVLYTLGRSSQQPGSQRGSDTQDMEQIYKKLFPVLMQLACDVEQVARQLFEPLVMQLIHWFTSGKMYGSAGTQILLVTIMDGLVSPTDTALRDFSAKCVHEFLRWSIKQATKKQMEKSPYNVEMLVKKVSSLARHPSSFKRLGASLAFNNIYTLFREEDSLVDVFTYEIIFIFVESLAIAHQDDKSLGTQEQTKKVLKHLERIIVKKAVLLSKISEARKIPKGWQEATLPTCIRWLLRQCGRPQTECRHACMELICNLTTAVPGVKKPADFLTLLAKESVGYYIQRFEFGLHNTKCRQGLGKRPKMTDMSDTFSLKIALSWFDLLLCTLDCYTWVFSTGLLTPAKTLIVSADSNKGTVVFKVLVYFFEELAQSEIETAAKLFDKSPTELFTPREREEYNRSKCTVIVRVMDFIGALLKNHRSDCLKVIPGNFWNKSLWSTICACILCPTNVGFNMANVEILNELPQQTGQLLTILKRYLPDNILKSFTDILPDLICKQLSTALFTQLPISLDDSQLDNLGLSQLVGGYKQLHTTGLLLPALGKGKTSDSLARDLLDTVFKGLVTRLDGHPAIVPLTPTSTKLAGDLLQLAFILKLSNEDLMSRLLDKSPIQNTASHAASPHGAIFYSHFKSTINAHLVANSDAFLPQLMRHVTSNYSIVGYVLTGMIEQIARDRHLRKQCGEAMVKALLSHWGKLRVWWEGSDVTKETMTTALGLLTKLILIDSKSVCDVKVKTFTDVYDMYLSMLLNKTTSLAFKSRVLDLLAFFCNLPDVHIRKLKRSLDRFVDDNFPQCSTEYAVGSPKYNDYITALNKILSALELSGSVVLLEILISIVCKEDRHVHEDEMQNVIIRYVRRLSLDKQKPALDVAYNIFCREGGFRNSQRRAALERVCLSMLRVAHLPALKEFFTDHIKDIVASIELRINKQSESVFETQLVSKMCNFELIEVMYSRLTKEEVRSRNSVINQKYCSPKADVDGKEMTLVVTKAAHAAKSEDIRGETVFLELRRHYHCAAYNALIAVVSCTQTDVRFYKGFLFSEDTDKKEFLWENLIDQDKEYSFVVEMETPLARRKKFVAIRQEHRAGDNDTDGDGASVRYLSSQYLADSSLGGDISQYDFTASVQASAFGTASISSANTSLQEGTSFRRRDSRGLNETIIDVLDTEVTVDGDYVEMEMDEFNQHECMASLIAVLRHMYRNNITPEVTRGESPSALPQWMNNFLKKLQHPHTPRNTRLYLVKLIINTEEVFRPYARFWLGPLVQVVTRGDLGTDGINYFITDVVVTLLSWHTVAIPEDNSVDRGMASRLLEVLMRQCHHDTRPVLKNNLEVLKTLVEVWKSRIEVPTKVLYENFTDRDMKSKRNMTGIQMTGVVLANQLSPYRQGYGVDKDKFYKYLAMNMQNSAKVVYTSSAEVVGITLKYLTDTERGSENTDWLTQYQENISNMLLSFQETKPDRFICCVHRMQLHYPAIADRFLPKILFLLPKVYGEFKTNCLEIIENRITTIDNAFIEMKNKDISGILAHRNELTQHTALRLVKGLSSQLKPEELLYLLPSVTAFTTHPSAHCRTVMYDILMWIYDNYKDDDTDEANDIISSVKEGLLLGLSDDDLKNRLTIQNFWSDASRLPVGTLDRLVAMLEAMYSAGSERQYLGYATNLLLEMTSKSPDYNRNIFEHPLSDCKFENYRVRHSWKQRHAGMTPLFVDTQSSQSTDSPPEGDTILSSQLRATQEVQQFTATQDPGSSHKAPYNWLTQSSMDTFSDTNLTIATETPSSLLFTVGSGGPGRTAPRPGGGRNIRPGGPGFGTSRLGPSTSGVQPGNKDNSQSSEILRLKRRFIKDSKAKQAYFAKKEARLKRLREEVSREQRQKRENQVTMYRKYRIGDLPDIQIQYSSVIAPLQALAQKDSMVARLLFSSIFKAIYAEIDNVKTERESVEISKEISTSLNNMLNLSTQYYPPFINCVLDMAFCNTRKLCLDPASVNTACVASLQQPMGITLLETMLIHTDPAPERPSKRSRTVAAQVSRDITPWLELARLYKSIGDYDVLKGIFSSQLGTKKVTSEAMEAEMSGDYQTAVKLYTTALERPNWDEEPNEVEMDLWDASRLQCYEHLTQWNNLYKCTVTSIDDNQPPSLDKVWEDTYFQETYLPYLLRSKLKLLLEQGDGQDDLAAFIDGAMKFPERKALLESQYSEELALLYIWQDEYDRAAYHTNHAIQLFLQDWSSLDCLMSNSRTSHLRTLQKLTEMYEFLDFVRKESNLSSVLPANQLIGKWVSRSPDHIMDPSGIWDDVTSNRLLYLDHIAHRIETTNKMEVDEGLFDRHKVVLRLSQAESARQQDNFPVAMKQMKNILTNLVKNVSDESLRIECYHTYTRIQHRKCQVAPLSTTEKLTALAKTVDSLDKLTKNSVLKTSPRLERSQYMLQGQAILNITMVIQEGDHDIESLSTANKKDIKAIANCTKNQYDEIVNSLIEEGYKQSKMAVCVTTEDRTGHRDVDGINAAHMALVSYCDRYLRQREDDEGSSIDPVSMSSFPGAVVVSLLAAMQNNSEEARQRFPRLLQLVEIYPETMDIFIKKASSVPTWMFLSWISQITALLDKPESPAVQNILLNMASTYPEALIYPFKMSCDGYQFNNDKQGKQAQAMKTRLQEILSGKREVDSLIMALEQFGQPNAIFKDWVQDAELHRLMTHPRKNAARIRAMYQEMFQQLVEGENNEGLYDNTSQSQTLQVTMGPFRTKFSKVYRREIEQKFGRDGSKLLSYTISQFHTHAKAIAGKMDNDKLATVPPVDLKEYSQWLADFQACIMDNEIEIPGQYTGQCKPLPEYHTKIASFDNTVKVMTSLRKPKRITMLGNDQKEYPFLVKGGEDLRLDQRIEQLFTLMNQVFTWDAMCHQRRLQLRTYQVIPMTTRVGLIEWMSGTMPLKEFLHQALTKEEDQFINSTKGPKADYAVFLKSNQLSSHVPYLETYKKYSRSDIITSFKNRENLIPWDLSRRAYQNMAASPEAFFTLKSNFAVSHGQLSICQYMLGIGDRHLSNFMVDLQNGKMVGIDFGHAFGSATQFLPAPELMPIRMTRQIRNLMMPLREKGLMESTMIHTLRALRSHADLLLNTMDVFIKEPSLDWKQFAGKQIKSMNTSAEDVEDLSTDQEWYPRQKVAYARRKFEGHNPAYITRDELKLGHSKGSHYSKAAQVVLGDKDHDIRARLPPKGLTVEQQVACLMNQATDPHILGRVYFGWEPWV